MRRMQATARSAQAIMAKGRQVSLWPRGETSGQFKHAHWCGPLVMPPELVAPASAC